MIDIRVLNDFIYYKEEVEESIEGKTYKEPLRIDNVRVEYISMKYNNNTNYLKKGKVLVFIDYINTKNIESIKNIKTGDIINYNNKDYTVYQVDILKSINSLHHMEVWCE